MTLQRQLYLDGDGVLAVFDAGGILVHHEKARESLAELARHFDSLKG